MLKSIVDVLKPNHTAIVWQIILPDYLAGICHYARPSWWQYLSGETLVEFPVIKARQSSFLLVKTTCKKVARVGLPLLSLTKKSNMKQETKRFFLLNQKTNLEIKENKTRGDDIPPTR